ncbi:ABC transporter ATP-binding protein, partial [Micromonospora sp. NPDC049580]
MASRTSRDVLGRGLGVLRQAIREQPRIFAVAVIGSVLFGSMVIVSAYVVGAVVGDVVVPAIARG